MKKLFFSMALLGSVVSVYAMEFSVAGMFARRAPSGKDEIKDKKADKEPEREAEKENRFLEGIFPRRALEAGVCLKLIREKK